MKNTLTLKDLSELRRKAEAHDRLMKQMEIWRKGKDYELCVRDIEAVLSREAAKAQ